MDWIKQKMFQNWVIGVLVALNVLVLTVVWLQSTKTNPPSPKDARNASSVSVELMQRELGLSAEQVAQYEKLRAEQMDEMKGLNDELDRLKLRLVEDMFDTSVDSTMVRGTITRIGELQSQLEMLRYKHFNALARLCNPEQQAKLRPVLQEVLARPGPSAPAPSGQAREGAPAPRGEMKPHPVPERDRPAPPTMEEKVERYVQRLSLSSEQARSIERILRETRVKEESYKTRNNPSEQEFEREKERLRSEEDQLVIKILDQKQRMEFERMIQDRRQGPRK